MDIEWFWFKLVKAKEMFQTIKCFMVICTITIIIILKKYIFKKEIKIK